MSAILSLALGYARKKLLEPSTWAGIVTGVAGTMHISKISPELLNAIDTVAVAVVSLLLVAVNERRKLPAGTVPVVAPADPGVPAVVQDVAPAAPSVAPDAGAGVQSIGRPDVSSANTGVRPGFGDHRA